jgi:hypothetical protein
MEMSLQFMPAFQASAIGLRYPGLTAWAVRYWPFRPLTGNFDFAETGNFNFARPAILTLQKGRRDKTLRETLPCYI